LLSPCPYGRHLLTRITIAPYATAKSETIIYRQTNDGIMMAYVLGVPHGVLFATPCMSCITLEYIYCYTTQRPVTGARQNVAVTLQ
jgi:hypothetical protein